MHCMMKTTREYTCINQDITVISMSDQVTVLTYYQLTVLMWSETLFYFGRRVVDSASFGENLREKSRKKQHIEWLADYL